jgi:SAM-dependent methyltransferase
MHRLPFTAAAFDLIWCEGAAYIMGFERGLREWRRWLKPWGCLAVTELTWVAARRFWAASYPGMRSLTRNRESAAACGYRLLTDFPLPPEAWWRDFYTPLEEALRQARAAHANRPGTCDLFDSLQAEIDLYRAHSDAYGYVFCVMQRNG